MSQLATPELLRSLDQRHEELLSKLDSLGVEVEQALQNLTPARSGSPESPDQSARST